MVFADWTFSGTGAGALDAAVKYSGVSSYKSSMPGASGTNALTHDTFLEPQAVMIAWIRIYSILSTVNTKAKMNHSSYGELQINHSAINTWEKFKVVYWYDISADARFGRIYKWVVSDWVQQGTDTNFGSGSPAAGTVALNHWSNRNDSIAYFDDVEVSA